MPFAATAVTLAALAGQWRCVRALVGLGANVLLRDSAGWLPLHRAVLGGCERTVREIILAMTGPSRSSSKRGGVMMAFNESGGLATPLDIAIGPRGGPAAAGLTAVHLACVRGRADLVDLLLTNGASSDLRAPNGWGAVHFAAAVSADFYNAIYDRVAGSSVSDEHTLDGDSPDDIALAHGAI
jgi:ankyrin repeat protein